MSLVDVLERVLDELTPSFSDNKLTALRVDEAGIYRVARLHPAGYVLVITTEVPAGFGDVRLPHFAMRMNARVGITDETGVEKFEHVSIIEVLGPSGAERDAFLAVVSAVVYALGAEPSGVGLVEVVESLVGLFAPGVEPRGSALGLWGELLVILASPAPAQMISSWHDDPMQLHDFAQVGRRLEVKTTQASGRLHRFRLRQLEPREGVEVEVLSVRTTRTEFGSTIQDLAAEISRRIESSGHAQLKLLETIKTTLGSEWRSVWSVAAWDVEEARGNMTLIRAADIPRVNVEHSAILDVELLIDCRGLGVPVERNSLLKWVTGG